MALLSVDIEDFRCLNRAHLELDSHSTLICGPNGSGKSSILEAIFLLGRGRSFRTHRLNNVIRHGAEHLRVVGQVSDHERSIVMGIEAGIEGVTARVAGEPLASLASLSTHFPVQVIEPGIHKLIEEGPIRRRRFLDWGVFHVEQRYLQNWQRFNRALRQRNSALHAHASDSELDAWDAEFVEAGELVSQSRASYLESARPHLLNSISSLLPMPVQLEYSSGWKADVSLAVAVKESRRRDRHRKTSTAGPHRADILFKTAEGAAKDVISRGQQKLLATALILGQLTYHLEHSSIEPTLLLDDPAAELDVTHLRILVDQIANLGVQRVITSLHKDFNALGQPGRTFHVEQGTLTPV